MTDSKPLDRIKSRLSPEAYQRLAAIRNPELHAFVAKYVEICNPARIFVCTDSAEDKAFIREEAIRSGEERPLKTPGHTLHYEHYDDQGRDKEHTKFLLPPGVDLGPDIGAMDKEEGLAEIHGILKDIMKDHTMYILFFTLGPTNSEFSIPAVQITDSPYVAHSEHLLYRSGYEDWRRLGEKARFFRFVHSEGELDERKNSKNLHLRRMYIDNENATVYSTNTQYGGNTIGLKKLAMRLAIFRAEKEGWLTEHMLLVGVHGPAGRVTYFTGAFPSMCGKTSTAMIPGETILGDDIAYLFKKNGRVRAVNVEKGMFGIIEGINSVDDIIVWKALHSPGEIIFSNVLLCEDGTVYWNGKDGPVPERGYNHSGEWWKGKKDAKGKEIPPSHKNARFTLDLTLLENVSPRLHDPEGVEPAGFIYGGRDSDTWMPVRQAFDWDHGIITMGAFLESETTAATLGKEGVREFNPMSNIDFLSVPIGRYVGMNLDFGKGLTHPPVVFGVNYFLRDMETGKWLNDKTDKAIWLKWMELRVHGDVGAIQTPVGYIPKYEDLRRLFKEVHGREYTKEDYVKQFSLRVPQFLAKTRRVMEIYRTSVANTPPVLFQVAEAEIARLEKARAEHGDIIPPDKFPVVG
ncbi:MAG: phosphoenolpyruvate carboxykinase (GTP) [Anaerolineae bacterium]|nr:phosphoenolpyruvate carboxykinase (GTP) [Anaerolineae bacterium]